MSGLGASIYTALPEHIRCVLEPVNGKDRPVATRICATIGPQSRSVEALEQMLQAGMKIARFDFTYGELDFHVESFKNLRQAMQNTGLLCAVLLNPAGPELHVINRQEGQRIELAAGAEVQLTNDQKAAASASVLPINWPGSFTTAGLTVGSTVFVGQYLFSGAETTSAYLTVRSVEASVVHCVVKNSCTLEGPLLITKLDGAARNPLPCLSDKDTDMLTRWVAATKDFAAEDHAGLANGNGGAVPVPATTVGAPAVGAGEFLALPRTRSAADVAACRTMLKQVGLGHMFVMAKLEDMEGLVAHAEVLAAADAVMLSRGSLGTCMEAEKVFLAQKMLLYAANSQGKPVFVTRIMDSMTDAPRPTRAEATDVANLVLDGADGILLGSETFRGKYPVDVVRTVSAICRAAEGVFDNYAFYRSIVDAQDTPDHTTTMARAEALASSAVRAAHKMSAKLIVVFTVTGRTARLLAKFKPQQPLLTVVCSDPTAATFTTIPRATSKDELVAAAASQTPEKANGMKKVGSDVVLNSAQLRSWTHDSQAKRCLIYRGAQPIMVDAPEGCQGGDLLQAVLDYAKSNGLVASGDRVVVSQCPRTIDSQVMSEAGIVQLVTVDQSLDAAR